MFYIEVVAFFETILMELDLNITLTVCGRQHFFISFFTPKKVTSERFFWFQRDAKSKALISKLPVVLRDFHYLKGFMNRLGDITLTKTLP